MKMNWSSALDAAWLNGGQVNCHTAGDVFLLLKASDKVIEATDVIIKIKQ